MERCARHSLWLVWFYEGPGRHVVGPFGLRLVPDTPFGAGTPTMPYCSHGRTIDISNRGGEARKNPVGTHAYVIGAPEAG